MITITVYIFAIYRQNPACKKICVLYGSSHVSHLALLCPQRSTDHYSGQVDTILVKINSKIYCFSNPYTLHYWSQFDLSRYMYHSDMILHDILFWSDMHLIFTSYFNCVSLKCSLNMLKFTAINKEDHHNQYDECTFIWTASFLLDDLEPMCLKICMFHNSLFL